MSKRAGKDIPEALKRRPAGVRQHVTEGPCLPVLEVGAQRLVVISGQIAVDPHGRVIRRTIEERAGVTLGKCIECLASAGCTPGDVFKVNINLADLAHWTRFNEVYQKVMPEPLPVRAAEQAILLPGYLVEIEMLR